MRKVGKARLREAGFIFRAADNLAGYLSETERLHSLYAIGFGRLQKAHDMANAVATYSRLRDPAAFCEEDTEERLQHEGAISELACSEVDSGFRASRARRCVVAHHDPYPPSVDVGPRRAASASGSCSSTVR